MSFARTGVCRVQALKLKVKSQLITVQYQPTNRQPADLLTKPLPRAAYELHLGLGVCPLHNLS